MSTSFVQRIRDDSDEIKFYGIEPQITARAVMFELRTKDGKRKAFSYSYVTEADFEPETGIVIYVSEVVITIKGRKLDEIFGYFLANRLNYVQEDYSGMDTEDSSLFVESIEIKPKYPASTAT